MKPREWWINTFSMVVFDEPLEVGSALRCDPEIVHVIERSAYDALAKDHADDWKRIQDAEREVERLKAEATSAKARIADACADYMKIKAENERLKLQLSMTNSNWPHEKKLHEEIERLKAQLAVYREALAEIRNLTILWLRDAQKMANKLRQIHNIARAALERGE